MRSWEGATGALLGLFLASGATGLVYETIWARQLHLVFGTSQLAVCTVLASFMAGLALGGFGAARWAGRVRRPLMVYGLMEGFIGLYALVLPWLIKGVAPFYLAFFRAWEPSPALFGLFQLLLLGVLLLPPTVCMGATLPLLARFVTSRHEEAAFQVGRLYGANTLGAVLGTAATGFVLLPWLGLQVTTWWTVAANGVLALLAIGLSWAAGESVHRRPQAVAVSSGETVGLPPTVCGGLLALAAVGGGAGLVYEVAWFRLMVLMLGGSAYAFSIMLLSFLLGIGLGGWAGGSLADRSLRLGRRVRVLWGLAWLQMGVATLSWVAMHLYGELPFLWVWLYELLEGSSRRLWLGKLVLALLIMTPPACLMGASFPYLVRAAAGGFKGVSRPVGLLYGANTLGAIFGVVLGSLVLLPGLGLRGTVLSAVSLNLLAALGAAAMGTSLAGRKAQGRFLIWVVSIVLALGLVQWRKPPWDPLLMTSGIYQYVSDIENRSSRALEEYARGQGELLFYNEGLTSVVTVGREDNGNIWLANNGKVDASSAADRRTQVLLAQLPFAFRPEADRVLVIGLASGISAGSVTLHEGPTRIDIAEIEPAIVEASHEFDAFNHRPLADPRVWMMVNDARNHLLLSEDAIYDLVISEPSNPWITGVSNLFTREFFEIGQRKMSADGVWAQWVHVYSIDPGDLRSLLFTFADVYKHVLLFRIDQSDLVILGSAAPMSLDGKKLQWILNSNAEVMADFAAVDVHRPEDLLGQYMFSEAGIRKLADAAGMAPRNTDDNMRIEYSTPLFLYRNTIRKNLRMIEDVAEIPMDAVEGAEGLSALARVYAKWDQTPRRTLEAIRAARSLDPGDLVIQMQSQVYERGARVRIKGAQGRQAQDPGGEARLWASD